MTEYDHIRKIKEKYESQLMQMKGVVGCAVGYKYVDGCQTDELCIVCYVRKKKPLKDLERKDRIPEILKGIPTDVVESGKFLTL